MATAVAVNRQTIAEQEHLAAQQTYLRSASIVEGFVSRQAQLENEIAALTAQYDTHCEQAAAGNGTDPQITLNQLQSKQNLLRGTLALRQKAEEAAHPLALKSNEAARQLAEARWAAEDEELSAAVKVADAALVEARQAVVVAGPKLDAALRARDSFRRRVTRERGETL